MTGTKEKITCKQFMINWLCGSGAEMDEQTRRAAEAEEERVCSLEQDPTAKHFLYFMCGFILLVGTGLYVFWSLWGYEVPLPDTTNTTTIAP